MREYMVISNAIKELGALVIEEYIHPEAFGSAYCVFEGENHSHFRFVWDGKEGYGFLQLEQSTGLWKDFGPQVSSVSDHNVKLVELLTIAKKLASAKS